MSKTIKLTLGCDPEIFLVDGENILRSAIHRIGGTKHAPMPLIALGDGFAVQEDNVAMEFNIPPAANAKEFSESIQKTLKHLMDGVKDRYGYSISHLSAASFPKEELMDPEAQVFGCDPDYDAWRNARNPRPLSKDKTLRSCGGHIHVGYDKQAANPLAVIRSMDLHLGVPSILMDNGDLRKELYGKAGAYREKSYGVEYRTLSNFWVLNERLNQWAWENTERAVNAVVAQFPVEEDAQLILESINTNNKDMAQFLCNKYKLDVVHV